MTTPAERDPRTDPRPGDVVRLNGLRTVITEVKQSRVRAVVDNVRFEATVEMGTKKFRKTHRNAEVIHRAED